MIQEGWLVFWSMVGWLVVVYDI